MLLFFGFFFIFYVLFFHMLYFIFIFQFEDLACGAADEIFVVPDGKPGGKEKRRRLITFVSIEPF